MKQFLFVILALVFVSVCHAAESKSKTKDFLYGFAGKMNFDKGWTLDSYGWKRVDEGGKIEVLRIGFKIRSDSDLNVARDDLLEAIEQLKNYVNCDEKNRELFVDFPITEKNLKISVSYVDNDDLCINGGKVCYALFGSSKFGYAVNGEKAFKIIHQESYADAIKCVKSKETRKWLKIPTPEDIQKARDSSLKIFSDE
jgi:hypothetical protein